jgi:rod shape-determining protein MreB
MEMATVLKEPIEQILEGIRLVLEDTNPEFAPDILDRGILLAGGGSLIRGLDKLIEEKTAIRTVLPEDPLKVVAIGTGLFEGYSED